MWTIGEVKSIGKAAFKANYWKCVLVALILGVVSGGATYTIKNRGEYDPREVANAIFSGLSAEEMRALMAFFGGLVGMALLIGFLIQIFIKNPLQVGCYRFFKKNVEDGQAELGIIGEGFGDYGRVFVTLLLRDIFLCLWSLLFLIPGIIKMYSYRMVPYIVKDNPELSATEVITKSREMMNGHKWKAFLLDLSFIGWIFLGLITCGIVFVFWTAPYMESADAALYVELSK
ncbi:DUF975 family protein [Pseudobutyrivibrio sp.]|uniref:DUF975 family protein n=1 Tax=Pseudobutyrivibrio sp. TaxID=2014367 RepID=UPI00386A5378